jgi:carboxyl-terminal processing protease
MRFERPWTTALVVGVISLTSGGWLLNQGTGVGVVESERLLEEVHRLISDRFVDEIAPSDLYQMAIDGMLREIGDPHTSFLDRDDWEDIRYSTTGNYGGLGIRIDDKRGWITVVSVLPNTPAEREGLVIGDRIIEVEGESAQDWTPDKAVQVLRGPKGSPVNITIARIGVDQPLRFRIVRDEIHVIQVQSFPLENGVGYVRLNGFSREAQEELVEAIDALLEEGTESLVLDLRLNPGGLLEEGIAVTDLFLERGLEVVETRSRLPDQNYTYRAPSVQRYEGIPLVVLVNEWSASASEIVAGALQDHDRALIVGTMTFGKGSVQTLYGLSGGNHIKITTARWYTPTGRSIQRDFDHEDAMRDLVSSAVSVSGAPVAVPVPEEEEREVFHTDAGRVVYGGGGITPDVVITPDTLTTDEQTFRSEVVKSGVIPRDAAFRWAVKWAQDNPGVREGFRVSRAMRDAYFNHLTEEGATVERDLFDRSLGYVDYLLGVEVAGAALGELAQQERRLVRDTQVSEALRLLSQADTPEALLSLAMQTDPGDAVASPPDSR